MRRPPLPLRERLVLSLLAVSLVALGTFLVVGGTPLARYRLAAALGFAAVTSVTLARRLARPVAELEFALQVAQAQLVESEKLAAFGQLAAGIAHEVKNPVAGIVGLAQVAKRELEHPERAQELLGLIEAEGLRCAELLVSFLRFVRHEGGPRSVQELALNDTVASAARLVAHQLKASDVSLQLELDPRSPRVKGVQHELQQVLVNLALNSQQAMPRGGTVRIETGAVDGWAEIRFSDSGPGISEAVRGRLFEPFQTGKPGQGTGLGLWVSQGIIREHGGSITVASRKAVGTTFCIRLPSAGAGGEVAGEQAR
ncbi:MAG: sensor histidine kinase [Myxococcaceae bacterium]